MRSRGEPGKRSDGAPFWPSQPATLARGWLRAGVRAASEPPFRKVRREKQFIVRPPEEQAKRPVSSQIPNAGLRKRPDRTPAARAPSAIRTVRCSRSSLHTEWPETRWRKPGRIVLRERETGALGREASGACPKPPEA